MTMATIFGLGIAAVMAAALIEGFAVWLSLLLEDEP